MATTINASVTSTGLIASGDASGVLALQSDGATGLSVGANGKVLISNTALTTATAGTLEYDGRLPYFTPAGTQRGVIPGMQYYELNSTYALSSSTSAQAWVNGLGITVSGNTVYAFEAVLPAIKTTTTTSHTLGTGFGGTATLNNIGYTLFRYYDTAAFTAANITPAAMAYIQTASSTTTMTGSSAATNYSILIMRGIVSVNSGGTFIPQATVSATGPIYTVQVGAYFSIYPIGAAGSNINVGSWA